MKNKKCAFFENRICDESCMASYRVNKPNEQPVTIGCKRLKEPMLYVPTDIPNSDVWQ